MTQPLISDYLASEKRGGLSASSIKLIVVALKIFFRFLSAKGRIDRDPTETLTLPRIERYLPETLNELQVEHLIESIKTTHPLGCAIARSWNCFTRVGCAFRNWQMRALKT